MPPTRLTPVSVEDRVRWKELGGRIIESLLLSGAVAVLDASWLVALAESGGVLRRRQDLPEEAFLSVSEIKAAGCPHDALPLLVVSYPWLTPKMPDPRGATLRLVARAIKLLIDDGKRRGLKRGQKLGVIWDYVSLHQVSTKVVNGQLTAEEQVLFARGLNAWGAVVSHPHIAVMMVTKLPQEYPKAYAVPEGGNVAEYLDRGWTSVEFAWATLIKRTSEHLIDLGKFRGNEINRGDLLKSCTSAERPPPKPPNTLAVELLTKSFSKAEDCKLVTRLYKEVFERMLGRVRTLHYTGMRWGDEGGIAVCDVLQSGAFSKLETLHLTGNRFGEAAMKQLAEVVTGGHLPLLARLLVDRPNHFDLRAACTKQGVELARLLSELTAAAQEQAEAEDGTEAAATPADTPASSAAKDVPAVSASNVSINLSALKSQDADGLPTAGDTSRMLVSQRSGGGESFRSFGGSFGGGITGILSNRLGQTSTRLRNRLAGIKEWNADEAPAAAGRVWQTQDPTSEAVGIAEEVIQEA